ncbi:MAG: hypothetical protein IJI65_07235 [Lachnospiraceae bacterium]|nr:hypothetical protein [Lachnospiraceae bacterium]
MEEEKNKKTAPDTSRDNIAIACTLVLAVLFVVGIVYQIMVSPRDVIPMIALLGALVVDICIFIAALTRKTSEKAIRDKERYEDLYNAQKASYLVLRKNFDELTTKLNEMGDSGTIPSEEIIKAQKALAKVTIMRSKENADAILNSNDEMIKAFNSIQGMVDSGNDELFSKQKAVMDGISREITAQNKEIERKIEQVSEDVRTLKSSITALETAQRQAIPSQPVMMAFQAMPQGMGMMPTGNVPMQQAMPAQDMSAYASPAPDMNVPTGLQQAAAAHNEAEPSPELSIEPEPVSEVESELELSPEPAIEPSPELELSPEPELEPSPELAVEAEPEIALEAETTPEPEISLEPELTLEPEPELSVEVEPSLEPELSLEPEPVVEPEPEAIPEPELSLEPEPIPEPEPAVEPEPAPAPEPAPIDLSASGVDLSGDPNKALSPDEIAKLFASASGPAPEPAPAPEPEPAPAPEPAPIDLSSSGVDLSGDPNKALSPDEIAKLFASASGPAPEPAPAPEPEPAPAPEPAPIDLSSSGVDLSGDPNKALSPDEIAKLFASASGPAPEPAPEPAPAPAPEPAPIDLSSSGVDLSGDPNKALSPDEIAKLFAAVQ